MCVAYKKNKSIRLSGELINVRKEKASLFHLEYHLNKFLSFPFRKDEVFY